MGVVATLVAMALVGFLAIWFLSSDVGQMGCSILTVLILAICIGAFVLFFLALFGVGCMAMFS